MYQPRGESLSFVALVSASDNEEHSIGGAHERTAARSRIGLREHFRWKVLNGPPVIWRGNRFMGIESSFYNSFAAADHGRL